jgi:23S rRNA (pseudouridine1915-N3)-methyltransferase
LSYIFKVQGQVEKMKFSEFTADQWAELQPYLDTALLPVTGLTGAEMPHEAAEALERLRDVLDLIEGPFKGRVVTYPALQYGDWNGDAKRTAAAVCGGLKRAGFKYVIVAAAFPIEPEEEVPADQFIGLDAGGRVPDAEAVKEAIRTLWLRPQ